MMFVGVTAATRVQLVEGAVIIDQITNSKLKQEFIMEKRVLTVIYVAHQK